MTSTTYTTVPDSATIERTAENLRAKNIATLVVEDRGEALKALLEIVPAGVRMFANASITLQQIGFIDFMAENPAYFENLRPSILAEPDPLLRQAIRRRTVPDWDIGSVNALTEAGELVFASHGGSQVALYAYSAFHVVYVVGAQKICNNLDDAIRRVREHAHPLEDARTGFAATTEDGLSKIGKWLIVENETPGRCSLILVKEALGF